eukprot:3227486-Rhodomonas_salina.1
MSSTGIVARGTWEVLRQGRGTGEVLRDGVVLRSGAVALVLRSGHWSPGVLDWCTETGASSCNRTNSWYWSCTETGSWCWSCTETGSWCWSCTDRQCGTQVRKRATQKFLLKGDKVK